MNALESLIVIAAGFAAGGINAVVGSGSLITFPILLALGVPPITANASNSLGLVAGNFTSVLGFRDHLKDQRTRLNQLMPLSAIGAVVGAVLLLRLPSKVFSFVIPILVALALILVIVGPTLNKRMAERRAAGETGKTHALLLGVGVFATGIYGGYFGAAQGIILLSIMGALLADPLPTINGIKNVLALVANLVAGIIFVFLAPVNWWIVLLVAVGSMVGGWLGAKVGKRLSPLVLRALIVAIGVVAIIKQLA
jgi:uncharacterized membrane protein YfcA